MKFVLPPMLIMLVVSLAWTSWSNEVLGTLAWHSYPALVAALMWVGVARRPSGQRLGWGLLSAGLTSWVIGDMVWEWIAWSRAVPNVSAVDVCYLAGYGFLVAGLVVLTRGATGSIPVDAVLDGAIFAMAVGLLVWVGVVSPEGATASPLTLIVTASYPIFASLVLAALLWMRFHPERRLLTPGTGPLSIAVVLLLPLEPLSSWYELVDPDLPLEGIIDRGFHISFGLMVVAVFTREAKRNRPEHNRLHPVRLGLLGAALTAGPVTLFLAADARLIAVLGSLAISALVLARFILISRERENARSEVLHRASHDSLTGLANRSLLMERLQYASDDRGEVDVALLYLDIDRFKGINDTYGHGAGDQLLVELAKRVGASSGDGDLPARIGGDEFVVLFERVACVGHALDVAEQIVQRMMEPFVIDDVELDVSVSIGVAASTGNSLVGPDALLNAADAALYQAKRAGRGRIVVFDDGVQSWLEAQHDLKQDLRSAIRANRLFLDIEPVNVDRTGRVAGLEVRLRLSQLDGEVMAFRLGQSFVSQAGLSSQVAIWAMNQLAVRLPAESTGGADWLMFRVTASELRSVAFVEAAVVMARSAKSIGLDVVFEVAEGELATAMTDPSGGVQILIDGGARFAIQEFGSVGSTLTGAATLPFEMARIEAGSDGGVEDHLVDSLRRLAESLGLGVVLTPTGVDVGVNLRATQQRPDVSDKAA